MRPLTIVTAVLCVLGLAATAGAQTAPARELSLNEYVAELDRLALAVDRLDDRRPAQAGDLLVQLPHTWIVIDGGDRFDVQTDWVRRALADWNTTPTAATRREIAGHLRSARNDAAEYARPVNAARAERDRLTAILAASEFRGLSGPNWFDRLRQRAMEWFIRFLSRLLGSSAVPTVTNLLVYGLIVLVVILLAGWMYRSLRRTEAIDSIRPDRIPMAARPWQAWLDDARAAAARGEWSDAVHLAYWCGISFLETQGAWRPDRSRTPREYLRAIDPAHQHRPALQSLTRELEQVWYGAGGADAAAFDDALAQLKRLGCPSP
jgi:hypothetical protein